LHLPLFLVSDGSPQLSLSLSRACCSISQTLCCHTHTYSLSLSLSLSHTFTAACGLVSVNPLTLGRNPGQIKPQRNHRTRPVCQQTPLSTSSSPSTSLFCFLLCLGSHAPAPAPDSAPASFSSRVFLHPALSALLRWQRSQSSPLPLLLLISLLLR